MLVAALRDLQWRRRRFAITVIGTALVFAMGLLISGLATAFTIEVDRTLDQSGADRWVASSAAAGPFSAGIGIPLDGVDFREALVGVKRADPVLFSRAVADVDGTPADINLFGVVPDGLGQPDASHGRGPAATGEALVARRLAGIGDELVILGQQFVVVGTVDRASLFAGSPSVFIPLTDAQTLTASGTNYASMIVTTGVPRSVPRGYTAFNRDQTRTDLIRPLGPATDSINFIRILLWVVAALIVASVVYMLALDRTCDFAVFKATGVPTFAIGAGLALQAVVIAVAASIIGGLLAVVIAPRFPMDVTISTGSLVFLPVLAVVVGLAASLVGVRRIAQVLPAVAFGGP